MKKVASSEGGHISGEDNDTYSGEFQTMDLLVELGVKWMKSQKLSQSLKFGIDLLFGQANMVSL